MSVLILSKAPNLCEKLKIKKNLGNARKLHKTLKVPYAYVNIVHVEIYCYYNFEIGEE